MLPNKYEIPIEYLRSRLIYHPEQGRLVWLTGQDKGKFVGCEVTNKAGNTYRYFSIGYSGKLYNFLEHPIIWAIYSGAWPTEIDHSDGDGLNNKIENLKEVSRTENNKNHKLQRNNKVTGITGVRFYGENKMLWQAYSYRDRKQIQLGNYNNFFDACCARKSFEWKNNFSLRHGK